ncbi:MAG: DUF167 domain-containing protein [Sedimentisphaerales bacterium]|nr:DUF167 domain-containing protein [Sedimentisphaerales bacterium]
MFKLKIHEEDAGVTFTAKVVPGSSKTAVVGILDGMVKIKVAAPPEKGKANASLAAFLARRTGVRKNAVSITAGQTSPVKQIVIAGITAVALREKLGLDEREMP